MGFFIQWVWYLLAFLIGSLVAWLLAAVGAAQVVSWLPARAWIGGASIAFCLIPAWLLATNFKASDRSRDTRAAIELDRLFQALPDRASPRATARAPSPRGTATSCSRAG